MSVSGAAALPDKIPPYASSTVEFYLFNSFGILSKSWPGYSGKAKEDPSRGFQISSESGSFSSAPPGDPSIRWTPS